MLVSGFQEYRRQSSEAVAQSTVSQNDSDESSNALVALVSSIASSNLDDAQKYLAQVRSLSTGEGQTDTELSNFLSNASTALDRDDISGAQDALAQWKSNRISSQKYSASIAETFSGSPTFKNGTFYENVTDLAHAMSTSSLSLAMDSFNNLNASFSELSKQTSNTTNFDAGLDAETQLQTIGTNLSTGNFSLAQMAFDGFLASLSIGSIINSKA